MKTRVAYFGVFTALALIFSYVESLIPFQIGIPGVKLGLANLIIVIALYKMSLREAYLLSVTRVVLAGLIFGMHVQYSVQSCRRSAQPDCDGSSEKERRLQYSGSQHRRWCHAQCRSADRGHVCGPDLQCLLLYSCAPDSRAHYRACHRHCR